MAQSANAQSHATDRGSIGLGGSAGFTTTESGDDRTTFITIQPDLLYFLSPGLGLGPAVTYTRISDGDDANTSIGIGPEASYYFGTQSIRPFISGSFAIGRSSSSSSSAHTTSTSWGGSAGLLFLLSTTVGLSGEAFYTKSKFSASDSDFSSSFSTFGLTFGVAAFLF